jgi:hypothetical protein
MLAAMTADARRRYNNRVNLVAGGVSPWTVPAGVTSVNVFAASRGGSAIGGFNRGALGGGGGAAILNVPLTVTPGDLVYLALTDYTFWLSYDVTDSTGTLFQLETGRDAQSTTPGRGGSVFWQLGVSAIGGEGYSSPNGKNGDNGAKTAVGAGWLLGGGGGGTGNTLFPAAQGGSGGSSGDFAGITDPTPAGGGGGGFFPGLYYRDNVTITPNGYQSSFIFLEWD